MMKTSLSSALVAVDHATDLIATRLRNDLISLYEQLDELNVLANLEPMSPEDDLLMKKIKRKIANLNTIYDDDHKMTESQVVPAPTTPLDHGI